ncbi:MULTISPECIES: hypothetical protein [unclassified Xanthobacter]|uniref:hypothetical protein n=1 Tax=Xanthobacter TaxID=279 RepID=UPI001F46C920|nr:MULTISPECIES: hypothetical protein [unclassified Xanthobacter]
MTSRDQDQRASQSNPNQKSQPQGGQRGAERQQQQAQMPGQKGGQPQQGGQQTPQRKNEEHRGQR